MNMYWQRVAENSTGYVHATWIRSSVLSEAVYAYQDETGWSQWESLTTVYDPSGDNEQISCRMALGLSNSVHFTFNDEVNGVVDVFYYQLATPASLANATKRYFAGGQQIASRIDETLLYHLNDPTGTSSILTDDAGEEVGRMLFDGYGAILTSTIPITVMGTLLDTPDAPG